MPSPHRGSHSLRARRNLPSHGLAGFPGAPSSRCSSQWFSKHDHWTSSVSIPWELICKADSQALPQKKSQTLWGWGPAICVGRSPPRDSVHTQV